MIRHKFHQRSSLNFTSLHFNALHNTSLPIFHFPPLLDVSSPPFPSLHFWTFRHHPSLHSTFRRFVTILPFLHFWTFRHHPSLHSTFGRFVTTLPFTPLLDVSSTPFHSLHFWTFRHHPSLHSTFGRFVTTLPFTPLLGVLSLPFPSFSLTYNYFLNVFLKIWFTRQSPWRLCRQLVPQFDCPIYRGVFTDIFSLLLLSST